jgi:hypothetical protein
VTRVLVAQCTGNGACELPTGLPWYFALALFAIWLAVVAGAVVLGWRLVRHRRSRRRPRRPEHPELER